MAEYYPSSEQLIAETEVKHSRFITYVFHSPDKETAEQQLQALRELHPKANHHCWARISGSRKAPANWGCSDDGEPKGTAGRPMLNVLEHSELCEISVVVVRYFGGIKLGTGGLVRAYSQATQHAINQLTLQERIPRTPFKLTVPHHLTGQVEHHLKTAAVTISARNWQQDLEILGLASKEEMSLLKKQIQPIAHELLLKCTEEND